MDERAGCYVHIPFCVRKCAYCDFNSYSGYTDRLVERYVGALTQEIGRSSEASGATVPVDTIFFGGGTPTAIPPADLAGLLHTVLEALPVDPDAEITTEANPGSADVVGLSVLRESGFNRISFGVQSFDAGLLKTLDRIHSADEAVAAVHAARRAGFENLSIDLMFGLPNQTMKQWQETLDRAFALQTDHISLYSLIVEEGTGFHTLWQKGRLPLPDDDLSADMYQMAIDGATSAGFEQYEISNFARPGRESRHNVHYWKNDSYYGFGCGAVSYMDGKRVTRIKSPAKYAQSVERGESIILEVEEADRADSMGETMMLGLRLTRDGIDRSQFKNRYGVGPEEIFPVEIGRHTVSGLLEEAGKGLRLTPRGVTLANEVMMSFV